MTVAARQRNFFFVAIMLVALAFSLAHRRPDVREVDLTEARSLIDAGAIVVDVREAHVSAGSHIPGALLIPLGLLVQWMNELPIDKATPIVVYCNEGTQRGPEGTATLSRAGYTNAVNLRSGIEGWRAAGLPSTASN